MIFLRNDKFYKMVFDCIIASIINGQLKDEYVIENIYYIMNEMSENMEGDEIDYNILDGLGIRTIIEDNITNDEQLNKFILLSLFGYSLIYNKMNMDSNNIETYKKNLDIVISTEITKKIDILNQ